MLCTTHFSQPAFTCSKLKVEKPEQGVKYVSVNNNDVRMTPRVVLVSLLLTFYVFLTFSSVSIVNFEHVIISWAVLISII